MPPPRSISEQARQFLELPTHQVEYPAPDDVEAWERFVRESDAFIRDRWLSVDLPVTVEDCEFAGVRTYVAHLNGADDGGPIYLEFHGGLVMGGGDVCRRVTAVRAMISGMTIWGVDYRLAPAHPFPAAVDDALAVYRALLEVRDPADVFVGGPSGGGNVATALLVRAKEEGLTMPAALVLSSPGVDLTESGDSFHASNRAIGSAGSLRPVYELYAGGHDLADPRVSPLFADLSGFPPTLLLTGTRDPFLSNTVRMHRKLRTAGVEVELHVFEAMPNGGFGGDTPEDLDKAAEWRRFLDRHRRRG